MLSTVTPSQTRDAAEMLPKQTEEEAAPAAADDNWAFWCQVYDYDNPNRHELTQAPATEEEEPPDKDGGNSLSGAVAQEAEEWEDDEPTLSESVQCYSL